MLGTLGKRGAFAVALALVGVMLPYQGASAAEIDNHGCLTDGQIGPEPVWCDEELECWRKVFVMTYFGGGMYNASFEFFVDGREARYVALDMNFFEPPIFGATFFNASKAHEVPPGGFAEFNWGAVVGALYAPGSISWSPGVDHPLHPGGRFIFRADMVFRVNTCLY